ncbi:30S ribosomal protein S16-2, chloroplastic/mitochondrial [Mucuna pruriens]|uniref:30S ribosomal protein S16-2, chloroplastic/mitochondrial n=1 Tax=Mucuna pruriens TaxID=157652 RepID=A0A371H1G3_MUCPR|nr:30S ribosomal protein S16-2, chloroplastic/mitochondrial [Mucuna pruriens]
MVVRIRLSRFGCKNKPFYRVMAADSRSPRDGKHLEVLGYYNPLPGQDGGKRMGLNFERVKYWLSVGAQPSEPVERILFRAGILPPPPMVAMGRKGGPRDTRPVDALTGHIPLISVFPIGFTGQLNRITSVCLEKLGSFVGQDSDQIFRLLKSGSQAKIK